MTNEYKFKINRTLDNVYKAFAMIIPHNVLSRKIAIFQLLSNLSYKLHTSGSI